MNRRDTGNVTGDPSGEGPAAHERLGIRVGGLLTDGLQLIICTVAVVIACVAYGPFFIDSGYLPRVAGAAVLGTLCGIGVVRWRRPSGLAWALSAVAFVLYAVYLVFPDAMSSGLPGLPALAAVGDGLLNGLARMLTVTPPADVQGDLLILPVALAFAAGFASAVSCARRSVLLPVLPPLLVFVTALLLSANAAEFRWRTTPAFLGCALALILLRANQTWGDRGESPRLPVDGGRSAWRVMAGPLLLGVPVIVGVTLLAVTATGALPIADGSTRFDPRAARQVPLTIQDQLNPLVGVREQLLLPAPVDVFTVRAADDGQIPINRIRTAALDSYDGIQWVSTARFVRTGSTLPAGPDMTDPTQLTVDITLTDALPAPFLPEFGRPVSIQATQVGYDPATGLLATSSPTLGGYRYRITGDYVASTPDPASAVPAPRPSGDRSMTELPALPGDPAADLRTLAQQWTAGMTTPYAQLTAIADRMRQLSYALDATPGHSFAALDRFAETTDPSVDRRVTEEQTAAAFTIMARTLGYPARVAVGYRLDPQRSADGALTVTTQDADAWAEVAFEGRGWIPFQVTPPRQGDPPPPPATPQGEDQVTITPAPPTGSGPSAGTGASTIGTAISWAIALAVLPLLLLIAAVGAVAAVKQWRRKHRSRTGSSADRIIGAWRETTDRLLEHGMKVTTVRTPTDIGEHTTERFGGDAGKQVTTLAPIVSHALYAPDEPDEAAVARAWDLESELHAILDSRRPWWAGALFWIDPRPLWHRKHHRTGRTPPPGAQTRASPVAAAASARIPSAAPQASDDTRPPVEGR